MIYVSSACIKKNNIAEIIQSLAENGIKNIELSGGTDYYSGLVHDLGRLKQRYGLNYVCHAYFPPHKAPFVVNLAACNDKIYRQSINHYVECIEKMSHIGCKALSVHAGFLIEIKADEIGKTLSGRIIYDKDKAYERFCEAYEYIKKLCAQKGMKLYLENNVLSMKNYKIFGCENYMMMTDHDSIMKMKKQIDFDLLLDLGHLHVSACTLKKDYRKECDRLGIYVKWIHISENNGIFDEHKPLREGSEIMQGFQKIYTPYIDITLETVGSINDVLGSLKLIMKYSYVE